MSAIHLGRVLLALGVLVGAAAAVGLVLGFEPARLPPALLNIAAYKLTFLAALAILAAGASLVRYARQRARSAPPGPASPVRLGRPELVAGRAGGTPVGGGARRGRDRRHDGASPLPAPARSDLE
jgi:hypothetical protein